LVNGTIMIDIALQLIIFHLPFWVLVYYGLDGLVSMLALQIRQGKRKDESVILLLFLI